MDVKICSLIQVCAHDQIIQMWKEGNVLHKLARRKIFPAEINVARTCCDMLVFKERSLLYIISHAIHFIAHDLTLRTFSSNIWMQVSLVYGILLTSILHTTLAVYNGNNLSVQKLWIMRLHRLIVTTRLLCKNTLANSIIKSKNLVNFKETCI